MPSSLGITVEHQRFGVIDEHRLGDAAEVTERARESLAPVVVALNGSASSVPCGIMLPVWLRAARVSAGSTRLVIPQLELERSATLNIVRGDVPASSYRTNTVRRGIGALIAIAPVLLLGASLLRALVAGDRASTTGLVIVSLGMAFAVLNFYLSFLRARLTASRTHISVIPMVATLVVLAGAIVGFGSLACAGLGIVATVIDTGGPGWFVFAIWKDKAFWDTPIDRNA